MAPFWLQAAVLLWLVLGLWGNATLGTHRVSLPTQGFRVLLGPITLMLCRLVERRKKEAELMRQKERVDRLESEAAQRAAKLAALRARLFRMAISSATDLPNGYQRLSVEGVLLEIGAATPRSDDTGAQVLVWEFYLGTTTLPDGDWNEFKISTFQDTYVMRLGENEFALWHGTKYDRTS